MSDKKFDPAEAGILQTVNIAIITDEQEIRCLNATKPFMRLRHTDGSIIMDLTLTLAQGIADPGKAANAHWNEIKARRAVTH